MKEIIRDDNLEWQDQTAVEKDRYHSKEYLKTNKKWNREKLMKMKHMT